MSEVNEGSNHTGVEFSDKLVDFVELSQDGYAIIDSQDRFLYWNAKYADIMGLSEDEPRALTFYDVLRRNFEQKRGIRVDSGNIDSFIETAKVLRRSRSFRLFEVNFVDGRWFLISEQLNERSEMLIQIKDITKQKIVEITLESRISDLRLAALTDELTKIGNRRCLVSSVNNELSRCRRTGASMTMLLIDLDFFKKVNDQYGHQAGDQALVHVADLIKASLRPYDILGRIGGEEFAVFLSNTTSEKGDEIAERTRQLIAESPLDFQGQQIALTASIGMTTLGCNAKFEDLYQQADEALYVSKEQGRNQVSHYVPRRPPLRF